MMAFADPVGAFAVNPLFAVEDAGCHCRISGGIKGTAEHWGIVYKQGSTASPYRVPQTVSQNGHTEVGPR